MYINQFLHTSDFLCNKSQTHYFTCFRHFFTIQSNSVIIQYHFGILKSHSVIIQYHFGIIKSHSVIIQYHFGITKMNKMKQVLQLVLLVSRKSDHQTTKENTK